MSEENTSNDGSKLATKGDWDKDYDKTKKSSGGSNNTAKWMQFDKEGTYEIRLVGSYVNYLRHWNTFGRTRVLTHPDYKGQDPAWKAGFYPKPACAIHCIDRADGEVKILDRSKAFFEAFHDYKRMSGKQPAGKEAPDFVVDVEWPGGNKRQANYKVLPKMELSPLTDEEIAKVKQNQYDLKTIYKSTPLEKIQELWDALPEDQKIPKDKKDKEAPSQSAPPKSEPPQASSPEGDESLDDPLF